MPTRTSSPASEHRVSTAPEHTRSPRQVAVSLVDVEATLRALDRTCLAAAAALLPPATRDQDISTRFGAAAAAWDADGASPPSYERQAEILSCLHDAGATLRAAAGCCERARILLEDTCRHRVETQRAPVHVKHVP